MDGWDTHVWLQWGSSGSVGSTRDRGPCSWRPPCKRPAPPGGGGIEPVGLIYFTAEGAQSLSPYEIGRTGAAVEAVLAEFGVRGIEHGAEGEGAARTFSGLDEERDLEVLVRLESREKSSTQVEVKARRGPVMADQDYARRLLKRILEVARQG